MTAIDDIAAERRRQIEAEGWTPEHDDEHRHGELSHAASGYAGWAIRPANDRRCTIGYPPDHWPWAAKWWKPGDPRSMLVKAGALIVAEIERLDRLSRPAEENGK